MTDTIAQLAELNLGETVADMQEVMDKTEASPTGNGDEQPSSPHDEVTSSEVPDHPQGAAIRRQVEYYFSDENLPTDLHLLQCCGGRENLPVSINRICGFKKMRIYKPKRLVVQALRRSTFLEVSANGKTVTRKVPLQGKSLLDPDYLEDDDIAYDPRAQQPIAYPIPLLGSKTALLPGITKNMMKPTGFEAAYVEPLQTPAEAAEEEEMYDPNKSFIERIEIAIQCFKQKRRMHQKYALVFNKLMQFGGIDASPRTHQGLSRHDLADMGTEERARALATHTVPWDRSDSEQWEVDFLGVCKAFLSSWYFSHYGHASGTVKNACQVLRSFYNYLLYHNVCPEYTDDISRALVVCDLAEVEIPKVSGLGMALPGDFNTAASIILGGTHAGQCIGDQAWVRNGVEEGMDKSNLGMRNEEAKIKFMTGVTVMGTDEQYRAMARGDYSAARSELVNLEVVTIDLPSDLVKKAYHEQHEALNHKLERLESLGKLTCKVWIPIDLQEWDLPDPEGSNSVNTMDIEESQGDIEHVFWLEESILGVCFKGMKLTAKILKVDNGLTILDDVESIKCSFYTWLPNTFIMDKSLKDVRWLNKHLPPDDEEKSSEKKKEQPGQILYHE